MGTLPYHVERDDLVLSLRYVTPSVSKAETVVGDLESETPEDTRIETQISEFSFDTTFYAVYAARSYPRQFPDDWHTDLADDEIVLVDSVINTFRGVQEEWADRGEPLNYYKEAKPALIAEALDEVEWRDAIPTVGGDLMSSLILKHALPNANHRTAVAYVRTYLESVADGRDVRFRHAGTYDGEWHDWAREHVFESKRLLMLRRKPDVLDYAKRFGTETVRRKSGVDLDLMAQDFGTGDIRSIAERGHRNRCVQFVREILERSDLTELLDREDDGRRAFVDRLR